MPAQPSAPLAAGDNARAGCTNESRVSFAGGERSWSEDDSFRFGSDPELRGRIFLARAGPLCGACARNAPRKRSQMIVGHGEKVAAAAARQMTRASMLEIGTFTGYSASPWPSHSPPMAAHHLRRGPHRDGVGAEILGRHGRKSGSPCTRLGHDSHAQGTVRLRVHRRRQAGTSSTGRPCCRGCAKRRVVATTSCGAGGCSVRRMTARGRSPRSTHVQGDARVEHVMLPIRDGVTIAVKR